MQQAGKFQFGDPFLMCLHGFHQFFTFTKMTGFFQCFQSREIAFYHHLEVAQDCFIEVSKGA